MGRRRNELSNDAGLNYMSLFLVVNTELKNCAYLVAVQYQFLLFMCKSTVHFSAPSLSASAPLFVCSGDVNGWSSWVTATTVYLPLLSAQLFEFLNILVMKGASTLALQNGRAG